MNESLRHRRRSQKQEKDLASRLGGKVTLASGALAHAKGDVKAEKFLAECKTTEKRKYKFDFLIWDKIRKEALREGMRIPLLEFEIDRNKFILFDANEGRLKPDKRFLFIIKNVEANGKSKTLVLDDLILDSNKASADGKIRVWRIYVPHNTLFMMKAEDFEVAILVD